jgi:hypothetical protein
MPVHEGPSRYVQRVVTPGRVKFSVSTWRQQMQRDRYLAAENIYIAEVGPIGLAEIVVDNTDFARHRLLRG